MNRSSLIFPIALIIIFLLPNTLSKFFIDLTGALIVIIILIPFLLVGFGWIGWKVIQSRSNTCKSCGTSYFGSLSECPICGSVANRNIKLDQYNDNQPASNTTIDIDAEETN